MREEYFQEKVKGIKLLKWVTEKCSICGYELGFVFRNSNVYYDHGCRCTNFTRPPRRSSFEEVAKFYNRQTNPDVIQKMNEFWEI